jgi:hypothetical protein
MSKRLADRNGSPRRAAQLAHAMLALLLFATAPLLFAKDDSSAQKRAAAFASTGMATTLARCDLPRSCAGRLPTYQDHHKRETSNDYKVDQRTLTFDGLTVEFWYVLDLPPPAVKPAHPYRRPQILRLKVSDRSWPVAQGLRVGTDRATVARVLGMRAQQGDCSEYVDESTQDAVTLCFKHDRVDSVEWVPWNDA